MAAAVEVVRIGVADSGGRVVEEPRRRRLVFKERLSDSGVC